MGMTVDTVKYLDCATALLKEGKTDVPVPIAGNSMQPFLREGDTVYLESLSSEIKKGDVVLYTRPDGSYVLHRVAKAAKNGIVMMLGDNQTALEPVPSSRILAEATSALRRGKLISKKSPVWSFYRSFWLAVTPIRPYLAKILR